MPENHAQLVAYIQKYRAQFPVNALRAHLVKHGFPAADVEKAITQVIPDAQPPQPPPSPPRAPELGTTTAAEARITLPKPANRDFILVVDDDPNVRELLVDYLKEGGFRVTSASDGLQAVIAAEGMKLQLILSDIEMPGFGSGIEAFKNLRDSPYVKNDLPVIFITGVPPAEVDHKVPKDPRVRLLHKPIDFNLLNKYIKELIPTQ